MTTPAQPPAWEDVLAEVEADLARTESLLTGAAEPPARPATRLSPAETLLPGAPAQQDPPAPTLPALHTMPPVPRHLAGRIQHAQARITELETALRAELAALDTLRLEQAQLAARATRLAAAGGLASAPVLFDSRA